MAARTPLLAQDVYVHLVRLHGKLAAEFAELFKAQGLTQAQYNVLRILRGAPDREGSCQYVGERLVHRVPDVTRLLDRMQEAGLVTRARSSEDRRVVLVRLTAKGKRLCDALDRPVMDLHRRQFRGLPAQELEALNDGLLRALGD